MKMIFRSPLPGFTRRHKAFSLIEVTMALGLVSFAVITVIGLMPVGLVALHRAMDSTEEAQIVRQIGAQAVLTPYSQLINNFSGTTFYYDEDGVFLTNSAAPRPLRHGTGPQPRFRLRSIQGPARRRILPTRSMPCILN